jgi:prefoldin subunit 5
MAINVNIEGIGDISIETGPMEAVFNDMTKALKDLKKEIHESDKIKKKQNKEAEDLEKRKNESTEEATKQNSKRGKHCTIT